MTPDHLIQLAAAQERLERAGWQFVVWYSPALSASTADEWCVAAFNTLTITDQHTFRRADRADALAQALQWAELEQGLSHVA